MKRYSKHFLIGLLSSMYLAGFSAFADLEVSTSVRIHAKTDFHGPLARHGVWIEAGNYGRCWRPAHVSIEWRPYGHGHWVWTECGWYWVSDEPWAWACYHYGGWVFDTHHGWVWVPGIEWAPAWVTWRVGGGYCGWAPLPPHGIAVAHRSFVFVEINRFHEPVRPSKVIVNNTTIIRKTSEVAGLKRATRDFDGSGPQKVVFNEGPNLTMVEKSTGSKVRRVSVEEATARTPVPSDVPRKPNESAAKQREYEANGRPDPATKATPGQNQPAPKGDVGSDKTSEKSSKSQKGKSGGKGSGKGKG